MTTAEAVKVAHRINRDAAYGTRAFHVTQDGRHFVRIILPDGRNLGLFTCGELARIAAGL